jgi:excisionase family DNA binding protein
MTLCRNCRTLVARKDGYCAPCELMSIPEALTALRLSRPTYYRLVRAGRIHPRKITAGRTLVPRTDVDAILKGVTP